MPSDLIIDVRQIGSYPTLAGVSGTESLLLQDGLGAPYYTVAAANLVATALNNGPALGVGATPPADAGGEQIFTGSIIFPSPGGGPLYNLYFDTQGQLRYVNAGIGAAVAFENNTFAWQIAPAGSAGQAAASPTTMLLLDVAGNMALPFGTLSVARDPSTSNEVATAGWVGNNTVASFNQRKGQVQLNAQDVYSALQLCDPIATQPWVQSAINNSIQNLLYTCPFVNKWNGRQGQVYLMLSDITTVFYQSGQQPISPTPPAASSDDSIATTAWVTQAFQPDGGTFLPTAGGTMVGPLNLTATGTPASRSAQDRFGEVLDVKDFGARGDGTTDDTAAVQAAFAAAAATGGEIWFPSGNYVLASTIAQSFTGSVTVHGAGPELSVLDCAANGLAIALASGQHATVSDLTIASTAAGTVNTGLAITAADRTAAARVENVVLRGNMARTTAWQTAISLTTVGLPVIEGVIVLMPDGTGVAGPTGILFAGTSPTSGLAVSNTFIQGGQYGIRIGDDIEGVLLTNTTIIGNDYSVYWPHITSSANMLEVATCHFNPGTCGIYAQQVGFVSITSSFFLAFNAPNWTGIDLEACNNIAISANNFFGAGTGTENGIIVNNASNAPVAITGNAFLQLSTAAITLSGSTSAATITGNNAGSMPGGAVFVNDITGNARTNQIVANSFNGVPDINANHNGIAYSGLAGGANAIGFDWQAPGVLHAYVDGTDEGGLISSYGGIIQPPGPLTGDSATALTITADAAGSGVNGPFTAQFGIAINHAKADWNNPTQSSVGVGEIDGLNVICRQGGNDSDCGGILINVQSTGLSFLAAMEMASSVVTPGTGTITKYSNVQLASHDGVSGYSFGAVLQAAGGALNDAIHVQDNNAGSTWANVLTNTRNNVQNFSIDGNGNLLTTGTVTSAGNHGTAYLRSDNAVNINWDAGLGGIQFYISGNAAEILGGGGLTIFGTKVVGTQIAGWGTPTGGVRIASFPGASATPAQTAEALAQLITDLRTHGLLGA